MYTVLFCMLIFAEINKQENLLTSKQTLIMALLGFSDSSYKKVPYLILTQDLFYISLAEVGTRYFFHYSLSMVR
jgi:hypothetical protein